MVLNFGFQLARIVCTIGSELGIQLEMCVQ